MLILMKEGATAQQVDAVARYILDAGLKLEKSNGGAVTFSVSPNGSRAKVDESDVLRLPGVARIAHIKSPYKLSSREFQKTNTVVQVGDVKIGVGFCVIAGPCSFEDRDQALKIARAVRKAGVSIMRGGIYKPRTSPFSFQGLREKGVALLAELKKETGLSFVTEAVDEKSFDLIEPVADMIQIGARNMQNFELLKRAARSNKPVLLKRGMSATLDELLQAADYVLSGNPLVVLCERGIKTFANHARNTLDISAVPALKHLSHLPVIADPSHATGDARYVASMALAIAACGADGVMVEVHDDPAHALSDGEQALTLDAFARLAPKLEAVAKAAK